MKCPGFTLAILIFPALSGDVLAQAESQPIDQIAAINAMTGDVADAGHACDIEATVYFCDPNSGGFFVGQGEDIIYVESTDEFLPLGTRVRLRGKIVARELYSGNLIRLDEWQKIADADDGNLVEPAESNRSSISSLPLSTWTTATIRVKSVLTERDSTTINGTIGDVDLTVKLPSSIEYSRAAELVGAKATVTGNLQKSVGEYALVSYSLFCPDGNFQVTTPPTEPIEFGPLQSIEDAWANKNAHFHLDGQVTFATEHWFFLQGESSATFIHNNEGLLLAPGDMVQVIGFHEYTDNTTKLLSKVVSRVGNAPLSDPAEYDVAKVEGVESECKRIKVRGTIDHWKFGNNPSRIYLRAKGRFFELHVWNEDPETLHLDTARVIEATGTCSVYGAVNSDFIIHVPSLADVRVVERKPLWSSMKIAVFVGAFVVSLVGVIWLLSLQRRLSSNRRDLANLNARLQLVSATVRDGVVIVNDDGFVLHQNPRAVEILKCPIEADDDFRVVQRRISRDLKDGTPEVDWEEVNDSRSETREFSVSVKLPETNEIRNLDLFTAPILDADGRYLARLWAIYDVTEKQQFLQSLAETEKQQAIGRLAGGIAHDFNNLLHVIRANLEVARLNESLPDQHRELLEVASDATDRAAELVSHLLSYSRRTRLSQQTHDINELVRRLSQMLGPTLKNRDCFSTDLADGLPPATVDDVRLEQVLLNLCLNAADAVADGGEIVVSTRLEQSDGIDEIVITVCDTGCGMSPETLAHAFEPFFTTKRGKGSGLGLAMAQGIVEQHHGRISCESEPGNGTTFRICLPVAQTEPVTPPDSGTPTTADLKGRCLLTVDDEPLVLRSVRALLESKGATVIAAGTGEEAVQILQDNDSFELVLLDWSMPGMHGREVLRHIRTEHPTLPVVICTGNADDVSWSDEDGEIGPDAILQKPFTVREIVDFLNTDVVA